MLSSVIPSARNYSPIRSSDASSGTIRLYDGRGSDKPLETIDNVHRFPVHVMTVRLVPDSVTSSSHCVTLQYSDKYDCVISADEGGFVEYWQPVEPFSLPKNVKLWSFKSETDLYEFKKVSLDSACLVMKLTMCCCATVKIHANVHNTFP